MAEFSAGLDFFFSFVEIFRAHASLMVFIVDDCVMCILLSFTDKLMN